MRSVTLHVFRPISLLSISTILLTIMTSSHLHERRFVNSAILHYFAIFCSVYHVVYPLYLIFEHLLWLFCHALILFSLFFITWIFTVLYTHHISCFNVQCLCVFYWSGFNCFCTGVYLSICSSCSTFSCCICLLVHPVASSSLYLYLVAKCISDGWTKWIRQKMTSILNDSRMCSARAIG